MAENYHRIDIAVIGAGVIGCAIAWKLSQIYKDRAIFVFEKNPGVTEGENQSTRNSGVIHSGIYYDPETRPNKARFCVEGNELLYSFCSKYQVPAIKTGKLIVATRDYEESILEVYFSRAEDNGVPGVVTLTSAEIKAHEPNIRARAGLFVPSAGVVDPASLVYRLYTLAANEGVYFISRNTVVDIEPYGDGVNLKMEYPDGRVEDIQARMVINSAGVEADRICRKLNPALQYELDPVRGESYKFYAHKRPELRLGGMNIYPTPELVETPFGNHFTVGIHLTPTFDNLDYPGRIGTTFTVGPKLVPVQDRDQWMETPYPPSVFYEKVHSYFPGIKEQDLIFHQMGLQARLKGEEDFIVLPDMENGPAIHLLGIDSPGLTSCLSIAQAVARGVRESKVI